MLRLNHPEKASNRLRKGGSKLTHSCFFLTGLTGPLRQTSSCRSNCLIIEIDTIHKFIIMNQLKTLGAMKTEEYRNFKIW